MVKKSVTVKRESGLEARPIAMLVQKASQFSSQVHIDLFRHRHLLCPLALL